MAFLFFQNRTKKGKERLLKQNNLPLNFFVDKFSGEACFYNNLHTFLMPYNIGRHFSLGTKRVKALSYKLNSPTLEDCLKDIQKEIISINFFIEKNSFEYKDLNDIKKHNQPVNKHQLISSSEIFLQLIEMYYTTIFPILYKMEKILETSPEDEQQDSDKLMKHLISSLDSNITKKDDNLYKLNGYFSDDVSDDVDSMEFIENNEHKQSQDDKLNIIDDLCIEQPTNPTK